ncbi:hypothetical protein F1C16_22515 (plasmid) [Hymenobacter sp. NBH84]|uniref:hypothetical protein n=1 Tax=Hymenobacter sp. NBH84 TaxID=2596915 RepID=UPI001625E8F9|nr:hypothetical protein [Hymenobacter sp. NBH84]QNE42393.1 hypothetical protein F1C16_22515 [Hymenobacter sp. NBH84]
MRLQHSDGNGFFKISNSCACRRLAAYLSRRGRVQLRALGSRDRRECLFLPFNKSNFGLMLSARAAA